MRGVQDAVEGSRSTIDASTIQAYLETEFRVLGDSPAILRVGVHCPELAVLHNEHRTDCSAFITACNPLSKRLDKATNAQRQAALTMELKKRSLTFIEAVGQHPSNQWPSEPSFLVLGLRAEAAQKVGLQFEQNAIIWSGADALPQVILLR